jgi:hypothetical protein
VEEVAENGVWHRGGPTEANGAGWANGYGDAERKQRSEHRSAWIGRTDRVAGWATRARVRGRRHSPVRTC